MRGGNYAKSPDVFPRRAALAALAASLALALCGCSAASREAKFLARGKAHLEKKDYARAVLEFRNAEKTLPTDAEPYYQEGVAYLEWGNPPEAYRALMNAVRLNPRHEAAQVKLTELLAGSRAELHHSEEHGKEAVALAPDDPEALSALALTELKLGDTSDAAKYLEQSLAKFPRHLKSSVALALVRLDQKDFPGAEAVLKNAVSQAPESAEPLTALGELYMMTGRMKEAEPVLRRALERDPHNAPALLYLTHMAMAAGRKDEAEGLFGKLSSLPGPEFKPLHALFLIGNGQTSAGTAELEKLYRADPANRNVRTRLIGAYVAQKRQADASRLIERALKENDQDPEALTGRAQIEISQGKIAEAQADANLVLHYHPDSAGGHYLMSRIQRARGNAQSRQQELLEALRLDPAFLVARLELAHNYTLAHSPAAALSVLEQAPGEQKRMPAVIGERNWAFFEARNFAEARKAVAEGLQIARTRDLLVQDAALQAMDKNFAGARQQLEAVLERRPEDIQAIVLLMETYSAQKQAAAAEAWLKTYVARRPGSAPLEFLLGERLLSKGDTIGARAAFTAAKAADPHFVKADLVLAQMDRDAGNLDAARAKLAPVLNSRDRDAVLAAEMLMGDIENAAGNREAAIGHWHEAVKTAPANTEALNRLAYGLVELANKPDQALPFAEKAHELAPNDPGIEDTLGWVLYRKGIYGRAVENLEHAVAQDGRRETPEAAVRKYHLAMAYVRSGRRDRALAEIRIASRTGGELPEAKMAQQVLTEGVR